MTIESEDQKGFAFSSDFSLNVSSECSYPIHPANTALLFKANMMRLKVKLFLTCEERLRHIRSQIGSTCFKLFLSWDTLS